VIRSLHGKILDHTFVKGSNLTVKIVVFVFFVHDHWDINQVACISPETSWPAVVAHVTSSVTVERQNVLLYSKVLLSRSPNLSLAFCSPHFQLFFPVNSREEHGFKTEISCKSGVSLAHPKCIYLPAHSRMYAELLLNPLLTNHKVVNKLIVSWRSLIRCAPTSAYQI